MLDVELAIDQRSSPSECKVAAREVLLRRRSVCPAGSRQFLSERVQRHRAQTNQGSKADRPREHHSRLQLQSTRHQCPALQSVSGCLCSRLTSSTLLWLAGCLMLAGTCKPTVCKQQGALLCWHVEVEGIVSVEACSSNQLYISRLFVPYVSSSRVAPKSSPMGSTKCRSKFDDQTSCGRERATTSL